MFQSVIVKNTFASIASVVVVVESPPPPPSRRLRALSRPRRRCRPCFHVYMLSCCHVVMNTLIYFLDLCLQSFSLIHRHQILQR